jgi:hypothetical protein
MLAKVIWPAPVVVVVVVVPARQPHRLASGAIVAGCEVDYLARNADRGLKISTDVLK